MIKPFFQKIADAFSIDKVINSQQIKTISRDSTVKKVFSHIENKELHIQIGYGGILFYRYWKNIQT